MLEYCPPEHVDAEIDQLTQWYEQLELEGVHPVIVAAWLHHRFIQIHPFADGNGRVARALTVRVMQRHQLAPLVIDRFHRVAYLDALDRANDSDLRPLIELFINLESVALVSELEAADTHLAAGERSGVMAVTTFAALRSVSSEDSLRQDVPIETPSDAFRLVHSESIEALNDHREELIQLLDEGLSVALAELARFL